MWILKSSKVVMYTKEAKCTKFLEQKRKRMLQVMKTAL